MWQTATSINSRRWSLTSFTLQWITLSEATSMGKAKYLSLGLLLNLEKPVNSSISLERHQLCMGFRSISNATGCLSRTAIICMKLHEVIWMPLLYTILVSIFSSSYWHFCIAHVQWPLIGRLKSRVHIQGFRDLEGAATDPVPWYTTLNPGLTNQYQGISALSILMLSNLGAIGISLPGYHPQIMASQRHGQMDRFVDGTYPHLRVDCA